MIVFDYIYYRITAFSKRWSKYEYLGDRGIAVVSLIQGLMFIDFVLVPLDYCWDVVRLYGSRLGFIAFMIVVMLLNYFRYTKFRKFDTLEKRWEHEDATIRMRRSWYIALFIVALLGVAIGYSVLRNNLGWI